MNWNTYILQINLFLVIFYAFYWLMLKKETFSVNNRIYLVCSAILSLLIPLSNSAVVQSWLITQQTSEIIYTYELDEIVITAAAEKTAESGIWPLLSFFYISGLTFFLIKFIVDLFRAGWLFRSGKPPLKAFSFFNKIFVAEDLPANDVIYEHEYVHVRQLHSFDVIFFEILAAFCWFNPVVYFYKISIKNIHEFIADEVASQYMSSKADYAMLLLSKHFNTPSMPVINTFFDRPSLKLRIQMLKKERSAKVALFKYGLIVPVFTAMLILTSATLIQHQDTSSAEKFSSSPDPESFAEETTGETNADHMYPNPKNADPEYAVSETQMERTLQPSRRDEIFTAVEIPPVFPQGGSPGMFEFIRANIEYPAQAKSNRIEGRVFVKFVINKDGSVSDVTILKGIGYGCDEEALRVIAAMPEWKPAIQNGKTVNCYYNMPVFFQLPKEETALNSSGKYTLTSLEASPKRKKNEYSLELRKVKYWTMHSIFSRNPG